MAIYYNMELTRIVASLASTGLLSPVLAMTRFLNSGLKRDNTCRKKAIISITIVSFHRNSGIVSFTKTPGYCPAYCYHISAEQLIYTNSDKLGLASSCS